MMAEREPNRKMKVVVQIVRDDYSAQPASVWGPGDETHIEIRNADGEDNHVFSIPAWLLWHLLKAHAKEGNVWMESPETISGTGTKHWIEEQHSIFLRGMSILRRPKGGAS